MENQAYQGTIGLKQDPRETLRRIFKPTHGITAGAQTRMEGVGSFTFGRYALPMEDLLLSPTEDLPEKRRRALDRMTLSNANDMQDINRQSEFFYNQLGDLKAAIQALWEIIQEMETEEQVERDD